MRTYYIIAAPLLLLACMGLIVLTHWLSSTYLVVSASPALGAIGYRIARFMDCAIIWLSTPTEREAITKMIQKDRKPPPKRRAS